MNTVYRRSGTFFNDAMTFCLPTMAIHTVRTTSGLKELCQHAKSGEAGHELRNHYATTSEIRRSLNLRNTENVTFNNFF